MRIGVFGCVVNPGWRELRGTRISVARAIQEAGGANRAHATGVVTVKVPVRGEPTRKQFNLHKYRQRTARTYLRDGSVVVVQWRGADLLRKLQAER